MIKSIKIGLASVFLGAAAYLAATWFFGARIEAGAPAKIAQLEQLWPFLKFSEPTYERGFFHSRSTAKGTLNVPGLENVRFTVESVIRHGPIPSPAGLAAAEVDTDVRLDEASAPLLAEWVGKGLALHAHSTIDLNGSAGESHVSVAGSNTQRLSWDGMTLGVNFPADLSRYTLQGDMPRAVLHFPDGVDVIATGFHCEGEQQAPFGGDLAPYGGRLGVALAELEVTTANGADVSPLALAKGVSSDGASSLRNGLIDYAQRGAVASLKIKGREYGPAHLDISVSHVNARALAALFRADQGTSDQIPAFAQTAQAASPGSLMNGVEIRINRLSLSTPQGEALLTLSFNAKDVAAAAVADPRAAIRTVTAKMGVQVPDALVDGWMNNVIPALQRDGIEHALKAGYIRRDGAMLKVSMELNDGQLSVNGKRLLLTARIK